MENQEGKNEREILDGEIPAAKPATPKTWLRRIGVAGFLFFLIKGLLWLAVFFGLFKVGCG